MARKKTHKDVEFMVEDQRGNDWYSRPYAVFPKGESPNMRSRRKMTKKANPGHRSRSPATGMTAKGRSNPLPRMKKSEQVEYLMSLGDGMDHKQASALLKLMKETEDTDPYSDVSPSEVLQQIDEMAGGYGVEGLYDDGRGELMTHSPLGDGPDAEYVSFGDTYSPTVLYDYDKRRFLFTSWGDWAEAWERKRGRSNPTTGMTAKGRRVSRKRNPKHGTVLGHIGDVNPLDYGGGYIVETEWGPVLEYFEGLDEASDAAGTELSVEDTPSANVELHRIGLGETPDEFMSLLDWVDKEDILSFTGMDDEEWAEMLVSPLGRAQLALDIAHYYGWREIETWLETVSIRDLSHRFDAYHDALKSRRSNPTTGMTTKGRRMKRAIKERGGVMAPSAVVYAKAKSRPGTGLVTKKWAREHGYPRPNPHMQKPMVGRRAKDDWHRIEGVIVKWEPYGAGMNDVLLQRDDGSEIWVSSHMLKPTDGLGPLLSRADAQRERKHEAKKQMRQIADRWSGHSRPNPSLEDMEYFGDSIAEGIAQALWIPAYADYESEQGDDIGPGEDWADYAGDPPSEAEDAAEKYIVELEKANKKSIIDLFMQAAQADGRVLNPDDDSDYEYAEDFGYYVTMKGLGEGVGWFDDHAQFPLKTPDVEAYFDGEELHVMM